MPTAFLKHCKHTCNQTAPTWLFNRSKNLICHNFFSPNGNFVAPILQSKGFSSAWHDQYSSNVMQCTEVSVPINICAFQPSVLVTVSFGNFPLPIQSYGEHMCTYAHWVLKAGRENQKSAMSLSCNVRMCLFRGNWFLHLPRVRAPVPSASSQNRR